MKNVSPNDVNKEIESSAGNMVIVFYKENGCSNCERMKPVMQAIETANKDTAFISVTVKDGTEVTPGFQFRMFPGIFSFHNGKLVRGMSGLKTPRQLSFMFSRPEDMKIAAYDARETASFIEKEISEYDNGASFVYTPVKSPDPIIQDPSEGLTCDSCQ